MTRNEIKAVNKIRGAYETQEETKLERLKGLNAKVKRPARIFAYIFGIIGALILGTGMCLAMDVIGGGMMIEGIVIGVCGIIITGFNYLIYKSLLKSRRAKYKDEIISLSNELLNNQ